MPHLSTLRRTDYEVKVMDQKKAELEVMPAIDFWDLDEDDDVDEDKYERNKDLFVSIDIKFDPDDDDSEAPTYSARIKCFKTGTPEEYCKHRVAVHEAATKLGYLRRVTNEAGQILATDNSVMTREQAEDSEAQLLIPLAKSSLRGQASRTFEKYIEEHAQDEAGTDVPLRVLHQKAWNAVAVSIFQHPTTAAKVQKHYLKEGGLKFCGQYTEPRRFYDRLDQICGYLPYFPMVQRAEGLGPATTLATDEKLEVLALRSSTTMLTMVCLPPKPGGHTA